MVRHPRRFQPPVLLWQAMGYLERYRGLYRACAIRLQDGRVLWFDRHAFSRLDATDAQLREAGVRVDGLEGASVSMNMTASPRALEPPLDRSYWVLDGRLIAGFYPGDKDPAVSRAKCDRLVYFGVRHVVCLMEENERGQHGEAFAPYREALQGAASERGVEVSWERHPIRDVSVTTPERMKGILDSIDRANEAGKIAYVHCWGGRGRTATVVGCWLARHGIAEGDAALERIDDLRSRRPDAASAAPESDEQREMVRSWRKGD